MPPTRPPTLPVVGPAALCHDRPAPYKVPVRIEDEGGRRGDDRGAAAVPGRPAGVVR